jgi:hypothetical protein
MYTMTVDEVLEHADAIVREAGGTANLPTLPVISDEVEPEVAMGIALPGEPLEAANPVSGEPSSAIPPANRDRELHR